MDLAFVYAAYGLIFIIFLSLLRCYWSAKKRVEGFPFHHIVLKIAYHQISGRKPKDVPFTKYLFQYIINVLKQHTVQGLLMTYVTRPILLIFNEDTMKFFSNEKAAVDKPPEYGVAADLFGYGLVMSNGMKWKINRKIIHGAFESGALIGKVPLFNEHALALVRDMKNLIGKPFVDLNDPLSINYFNALCAHIDGKFIISLSDMVLERFVYPWYRPKFLLKFTPFGRKFLKEEKEYQSFITNVIKDMKDHIASTKNSHSSLPVISNTNQFGKHLERSFTYMLLNHHLNDPSFTFENLNNEVSGILVMGYGTINYSTLWCLFLLALHPKIQEKAFNEIQSLTDSYVTYENTCDLVYLEAIILETLRLYSPVPIFGRYLTEDVQYGNYKVYKGTTIAFVAYLSQKNPDIYPNPEKFEPSRFLNGKAKAAWSYVPFSVGKRMCMGRKYALIEMKIFLVHILRNFKISTLDTREDIGECWNIGFIPEKPIRFKIAPRHYEEN